VREVTMGRRIAPVLGGAFDRWNNHGGMLGAEWCAARAELRALLAVEWETMS
jgi:hypothetical protein